MGVANYRYDPYGRTISSSGTLAGANVYRFSSKEFHANTGFYYLYRFYDPMVQRWVNRDPIGERGGLSLYSFVANLPTERVDPLGHTLIKDDWGYKDEPVRYLCNGKPYKPDTQCCQRGKVVDKIPVWRKLEYPSFAACVGDQTTCSPVANLILTATGLVVGIKGGPGGQVVGVAIGGFEFGDQLQAMLECSSKECPDDIVNDPHPGVVIY